MSAAAPRFAPKMMARLDELGRVSDNPENLTRTTFTPAHKQGNALALRWMQEAGMETSADDAGNVIGIYAGSDPKLPRLMLGSHLDTVRNAGKYDGMLGVIAAGVAVWWDATLRDAGWPLLMVAAFAGLAGAMGTRALEIMAAVVERKAR